MSQPAEQLEPLEIHNEDDVWNALYIFGVKDSMKAILKYYGHKAEGEPEEKTEVMGHRARFTQARTKDIEDLFNAFDEDQKWEALEYFTESKDSQGLLIFYNSFDEYEPRRIFEKLLFQITEENNNVEKDIMKMRSRLRNVSLDYVQDLEEAIAYSTRGNNEKTIKYLIEHMLEIPKFIRNAGKEVIENTLIELLNYL